MALGRREWVRNQGRANAALVLVARAMEATFVEPADTRHYGRVRGRAQGCTFELHVATPKDAPAGLRINVRHFPHEASTSLEGAGLALPDLDPDAVRQAVVAACRQFATAR